MPYTPKFVRVLWLDPESSSGWEDSIQEATGKKPPVVLQTGFLLAAGPDYLTLTSGFSKGVPCDRTTIPTGCVQSIEPVRSTDDLQALLLVADEYANSES